MSRRHVLTTLGVGGAAASFGLLRFGTADATDGPSSYTPAWSSVDQHPPAPEWFQDAKLGIYYHWGAFSVAAYGSEWYPHGQAITQLWNGSYTQSGANVTVSNASYNGALAAGASTTFGFTGSWSGANNPPASLTCTTT